MFLILKYDGTDDKPVANNKKQAHSTHTKPAASPKAIRKGLVKLGWIY